MGLRALAAAALAALVARAAAQTALIVPVHTPHFNDMLLFLVTYREHRLNADFHVVFSSEAERDSFAALPGYTAHPNVTLQVYNGTVVKFGGDPVVAKKFWAVDMLLRRYQYFMIMDSEVRIVRDYDLNALAAYIFNLKLLFGARTGLEWAVQGAFSRFNATEQAHLHRLTRNGTVYFWFNEIPVVEASSAARFMERGYLRNGGGGFDYIIYGYYLMLHEGFTLVDLTPLLPPDSPPESLNSLGENGGGTRDILLRSQPHWVSSDAWEMDFCRFNGLDIVMTFQNDRERPDALRFGRTPGTRGNCTNHCTGGANASSPSTPPAAPPAARPPRPDPGSVAIILAGQFRGTPRSANETRRALVAPLQAAGLRVVLYTGGVAADAAAWRTWGEQAAGTAHEFIEIPERNQTTAAGSFWGGCLPWGYHLQYGALTATWLRIANRTAYTYAIRARNDLIYPDVQAFKPCWLTELPPQVLLTTDIEIHQGDRWNQRGMVVWADNGRNAALMDYFGAFNSYGLFVNASSRKMSAQANFPLMACDQFHAGRSTDMNVLLTMDVDKPWQAPCASNSHIENILPLYLFSHGIDVYSVAFSPRRDPKNGEGPAQWSPSPKPCYLCYDCFAHPELAAAQ